jgi:mRNA-degrading endonuclease RelE of RelBE toxin-antitoxin system
MPYDILLSPQAVEDLKRLRASYRSSVREGIETHLRHQPTRESKSRIKRLKGVRRPGYRLRIGEIRVFYDVVEKTVEILAIIPKSKAAEWLKSIEEKL